MKAKEFFKSDKFKYILVVLSAIVIYILIYGYRIIIPTNTDWLLFGAADNAQHYLGWKAYRESAWHFPLGMVDTLMYPYFNSVIFTDSIPLFAVFFKLLSPILPKDFQYFGIWGLMCFILQGVLTAKIVKNYTKNTAIIVLAGVLSIFTPVVYMRLFRHSALAGQWLLLLGLDILFERKKYRDSKKLYLMVGLLSFLSASIHLYLALMNGMILIGICLLEITECKKAVRSILLLAEYVSIIAIVTTLLGGFNSGMDAQIGGLGYYSSNINTFINPQGWSSILKDLPVVDDRQWEGSGYLGLGFLLLSIVAVPFCIFSKKTKEIIKLQKKLLIAVAVVFLIAFVFALSNKVTIGSHVLFEIKLPNVIYGLWSIFRASGRAIWICVYLIELLAFISLIKVSDKRLVIVFMAIALMIQPFDIHKALVGKHQRFANEPAYESLLRNGKLWNAIAEDGEIKHVVYHSTLDYPQMYSITDWALDNDMTVNRFPFARDVEEKIKDYRQNVLGSPQDDIVYIFGSSEADKCENYDLHYYIADGLIAGCKHPIEGAYEVTLNSPMSEPDYEWEFSDDLYIKENGGKDTENGREIYPGGFSFGPYWSVPEGTYMVTISGSHIPGNTDISIYSDGGTCRYEYIITESSAEEITLIFPLDKDVSDFEIFISNSSAENAVLNSITMTGLQ